MPVTSRSPTGRSTCRTPRRPGTSGSSRTSSRSYPRWGSRTPDAPRTCHPSRWIECIDEDLDAGACLGDPRVAGERPLRDLPSQRRAPFRAHRRAVGERNRSTRHLLFEAPSTELQNYFVKRIGPERQPRQRRRHRRARARDHPARAAGRHPHLLRERGCMRECQGRLPSGHTCVRPGRRPRSSTCGQLGCKLARRYADRITLDFFGDQLVCHLSRTARSSPPDPQPLPPSLRCDLSRGGRLRAGSPSCACNARSSSSASSAPGSREWSRSTGPSCSATRRTI